MVAGYVAKPSEWAAFTKRWRAAIRPIKVYHAVDAANQRREFEGWTKEQVAELAARALPIIPATVQHGFAVGIQLEHWEHALRGHETVKALFGKPNTCCLHWLMATVLDAKVAAGDARRIAFYHE